MEKPSFFRFSVATVSKSIPNIYFSCCFSLSLRSSEPRDLHQQTDVLHPLRALQLRKGRERGRIDGATNRRETFKAAFSASCAQGRVKRGEGGFLLRGGWRKRLNESWPCWRGSGSYQTWLYQESQQLCDCLFCSQEQPSLDLMGFEGIGSAGSEGATYVLNVYTIQRSLSLSRSHTHSHTITHSSSFSQLLALICMTWRWRTRAYTDTLKQKTQFFFFQWKMQRRFFFSATMAISSKQETGLEWDLLSIWTNLV